MSFIQDFISEYGTLAMFIIILLEYACFPVSSEIVLPFSGAIASINHTGFLVILPLSILAGLIGTGICYGVGWFGGGAILHAIVRRFPKAQKGIDHANENFRKHGGATVCIGRVIPIIRTYISLVAGAARLNPVTYFTYTLLGITVWNTLLIGLGYTLQENYEKVAGYYERYKYNLLPIAGLCIFLLLINIILKKRKKRKLCSSL
jgi:membrane protein DedA with SNARE-associated domain